jgi:hypothetical protein
MEREDWLQDSEALLVAYARGPAALDEALTAVDSDLLDLASPDGGWTIRQIVHHIADGDDLWKTCIQAAIGAHCEEGGSSARAVFGLQWYWDLAQDDWAELWAYAQRALEPAQALFSANRCRIVQLLRHVPDSLSHCIVVRWPSGQEQEVTVGWVVEMQTRHAEDHIQEILSILRAGAPTAA